MKGFVSYCKLHVCPRDPPSRRNQQLNGYSYIFCVPKKEELWSPHPECSGLPAHARIARHAELDRRDVSIHPYLTLANCRVAFTTLFP